VGEDLPYNGGATPMAIFAYLDASHRRRVIDAGLRRYASRTPVDHDVIEAMCDEIRESGYAFSTSGYIEGTSAFAAPIFDADGRVQAAIGVTGVSESLRGFDSLVIDAARHITFQLGGVAPRPQSQDSGAQP
jgi:DNA-binding IclR family transcriptional regulator